MRIVCPHCQAVYQVDGAEPDTVFVCHRCDTEFGFGQPPEDAEALKADAATVESTEEAGTEPASQEETPPQEADASPTEPPESAATDETEADSPDETGEAVEEPAPEMTTETASPDEPAPSEEQLIEAAPEPEEVPSSEASEESDATETVQESETAEQTDESGTDEPHPEPEDEIEEITSESQPEEEIEEIAPEPQPGPSPTPGKKTSKKKTKKTVAPPRRISVNIWPWLFGILFIIAGAGLWITHDAWMNSVWLRSTLINVGLPIPVRDQDWEIVPGSVHAEWVTRLDHSHVLVIKGRVKNGLQCELHTPSIRIRLFAKDAPTLVLETRVMPVTQIPMPITIGRSPYITPPVDHVPVAASGERNFELVLETLPDRVGDFSLSPVVTNRNP